MLDEITYPFQNSKSAAIQVSEWASNFEISLVERHFAAKWITTTMYHAEVDKSVPRVRRYQTRSYLVFTAKFIYTHLIQL